jgi:hypothetical protein
MTINAGRLLFGSPRKQTRYWNAEAAEPREVPEGELVKNTRQQLKEETPSGFFSALPRTVQMSGLML